MTTQQFIKLIEHHPNVNSDALFDTLLETLNPQTQTIEFMPITQEEIKQFKKDNDL